MKIILIETNKVYLSAGECCEIDNLINEIEKIVPISVFKTSDPIEDHDKLLLNMLDNGFKTHYINKNYEQKT